MWSHLAEQLRAKPMGHGAARQPKGCSKEVNKGLPAALPGLQEPRESPARQCGGRSKSWFVSRKNTCPVKFHLGRSSKVNGWELVSLQWRAWQKSDKNNGYFSSQKLFPGRAPWFWHVLQCSVLWQEPVFLDLQPSITRGRGLKCWQISVSGMSQSKRCFWLNPERSESDPHLTQPQGWLCLRLQRVCLKGQILLFAPMEGVLRSTPYVTRFDGCTDPAHIPLKTLLKLYLPWQEPSWPIPVCAPNWSDVIPIWPCGHFSKMLLSP